MGSTEKTFKNTDNAEKGMKPINYQLRRNQLKWKTFDQNQVKL